MRNTAYIYAEFDRYLKRHHPKVRTITRPMVVNYLATTIHLHSTSRGYRVTLLRGFCRYLYQKNPKHYVPEARLLPWGKRKLTPHIYTELEIMTILGEIRKFKRRGPTVPEDPHNPSKAGGQANDELSRSGRDHRHSQGDRSLLLDRKARLLFAQFALQHRRSGSRSLRPESEFVPSGLAASCHDPRQRKGGGLWPETKKLLIEYLDEAIRDGPDAPVLKPRGDRSGASVFIVDKRVNAAASGAKIAKKTVDRTFRHTTAMHLLQSGVELTVIRSWHGPR